MRRLYKQTYLHVRVIETNTESEKKTITHQNKYINPYKTPVMLKKLVYEKQTNKLPKNNNVNNRNQHRLILPDLTAIGVGLSHAS